MARRAARIGTVLAAFGTTTLAHDALGYDAAVDATLDAQVYQVTSPFGAPALARRRYTETLGVRVVDIQGPHDPGRGELLAVMRLRLDADLGQDPAERDVRNEDRFIPGVREMPLDLMMAYVEGRNYAHGHLGFRLGRQYVVDPLGFWSFDGGLVRVTTDAFVAVEAYGGFEQRGGLPLMSTSRFEGDGVFRGDRRGLDANFWPAYLSESRPAPAWGFSLVSAGLPFLDARLTYRKVIERDVVVAGPFTDSRGDLPTGSGDRTSSERVGGSLVLVKDGLGSLRGDGVYDLYVGKPTQYGLSADFRAIPDVSLGVDGQYFLPTFDGDSIWNWFSHLGTTTLTGRVRWDATRRIAVSASGGVRRFSAEEGQSLSDVLASVNGSYRAPELAVSLRAMDEQGDRGTRRGGDVSARRWFSAGLYDASAVVSVYDWSDSLRPDRSATSFSYVLGGGYSPIRRTRIGLEWEHSMSELFPQRFRALCTLDLTVL